MTKISCAFAEDAVQRPSKRGTESKLAGTALLGSFPTQSDPGYHNFSRPWVSLTVSAQALCGRGVMASNNAHVLILT